MMVEVPLTGEFIKQKIQTMDKGSFVLQGRRWVKIRSKESRLSEYWDLWNENTRDKVKSFNGVPNWFSNMKHTLKQADIHV